MQRKAARITSGWEMAQEEGTHEFLVYLAEGDVIAVFIPTVVSKQGKKQWKWMTWVLKIHKLARNISKLKIMPHQSREAARANNEKKKKEERFLRWLLLRV